MEGDAEMSSRCGVKEYIKATSSNELPTVKEMAYRTIPLNMEASCRKELSGGKVASITEKLNF